MIRSFGTFLGTWSLCTFICWNFSILKVQDYCCSDCSLTSWEDYATCVNDIPGPQVRASFGCYCFLSGPVLASSATPGLVNWDSVCSAQPAILIF